MSTKAMLEAIWNGALLDPDKTAYLRDGVVLDEDCRAMDRCVIGDHETCPAHNDRGCLCRQMPKRQYLIAVHQKYGFDLYSRLKKRD